MMGILRNFLNGSHAAKAAKIVSRITDRPCSELQLSELKRSASIFSDHGSSLTEFDFAFLQLHSDYMCGPKKDITGRVYADYGATPEIKKKITEEFFDFKSKGLIGAYVAGLYEDTEHK